jgi:DNA primase
LRIPEEKIEEIRNAVDIVEVVGQHVKLRKRGKSYTGLCPFHTEKTPSFTVAADKQMYHCFGCGVGGTVFNFLMDLEKISFIEAVQSLARRGGIILEDERNADGSQSKQEELFRINDAAAKYFSKNLLELNEGKFGLEYLRRRGFSDETIKTFGLGYSLKSWDGFAKYAQSLGFLPAALEQAGLARRRDDGSIYDTFRGRVMFPIYSTTGRVLGFGARKLYEDDNMGKYINSPETPVYAKSRVLYGLSHAKEAIRDLDAAILVEGYADLISVYQAGIKNLVASSGTALTEGQVHLLRRYTKKIVVMYDADSAGSKATMRGIDLLLENGMDVRVAELSQGEDPDSFVRKKGAAAFREHVEAAASFVDFVVQAYEREGKLDSPEGKSEVIAALVELIAKIGDEVKRGLYIQHLAERYRLGENVLYRSLERRLESGRRSQPSQAPSQSLGQERRIPLVERALVEMPTSEELPIPERDLLSAMLEGGFAVANAVREFIDEEELDHPMSRDLARKLFEKVELDQEIDPSLLLDEVEDPRLRRVISALMFSPHHVSKRWQEGGGSEMAPAEPPTIARDAIIAIKKGRLKKVVEANHAELKQVAKNGGDTGALLARHIQLNDELKQLDLGNIPARA